jgi:hypothetical protein
MYVAVVLRMVMNGTGDDDNAIAFAHCSHMALTNVSA